MKFYTYLWLRENGTPYYVGKGSGDRAFSDDMHRVRCPRDPARIITQEFDSEEEAFAAECLLIAFYGRADLGSGCLRNLTNGGDGTREPSPAIRARMRQRMLGNTIQLGRIQTKETRQRMRESHLKSPRAKKHLREMHDIYNASEAAKKHLREMQEKNVGATATLEARNKIRSSRLGRKFPRKLKMSIEDQVALEGRRSLCSED
jgi:hypothetical protein